MQEIKLSDKYFKSVLDGNKKSTIRYGFRDYYSLDKALFYSDTSNERAIINILSIDFLQVEDLDDMDAREDGFENLKDLKDALLEFYPNMKNEDWVTKIGFEFIN